MSAAAPPRTRRPRKLTQEQARQEFGVRRREYGLRRLEALQKAAPQSLEAHARLILRDDTGMPLIAAPHHREICRVLEDEENFPYVCIVCGPGTAKSTWVSHAYTSWQIGRTGGNIRLGLISNTRTQAQDWARTIMGTIEDSNWFEKTYPTVRPDRDRGWTRQAFFVTGTPAGPNPTLLATGIGGPILGKRLDQIILDDPTTVDEARSDVIMEGQKHWFKTTLMTRLPIGKRPPTGKGSRIVAICTRWGPKDLVGLYEELGFKILVMPALGYWDRTAECPECRQEREPDISMIFDPCEHCGSVMSPEIDYGEEPIWPVTEIRVNGKVKETIARESKEQLEHEREMEPLTFQLVKQGDPAAFTGDMFPAATFQRAMFPSPGEIMSLVQYVDTAGGKDRAKGDYFAMATLGLTFDERVWILGMTRDRFTAPDQEDAVKAGFAQWTDWWGKPVELVVIEDKNEGIALYQNLVKNTRLPLKAGEVHHDKEFRAIPLANAYRARRVWHPDGEPWVKSYEKELEAFPDGVHDDQVDAASGAYSETGPGPRVRTI